MRQNKLWLRVQFLLAAGLLACGCALFFYPVLSNLWNSFHQSRAISEYQDHVESIDGNTYEEIFKAAVDYNKKLLLEKNRWNPDKRNHIVYERMLNVSGNGIMAYLEIPEIQVTLPVYHGTDEAILQAGAGHLPASSLPVGGSGTHCVIAGHRGLPSAKLFTRLDEMKCGSRFYLHVLDNQLVYETDQILVVKPEDLSALEIEEGKDFCTLMTCTPYGINTHRLLVRGHRVEGSEIIQSLPDVRIVKPCFFSAWLFLFGILYRKVYCKRDKKQEGLL